MDQWYVVAPNETKASTRKNETPNDAHDNNGHGGVEAVSLKGASMDQWYVVAQRNESIRVCTITCIVRPKNNN